MTTPVIECREVSKRFGDVLAVDNVSFRLMQGEVVSILGASGCGKTTLLRLIAGFEPVDSGEIRISFNVLSDTRRHIPPERRGIGMVFQEYALFPHLTVAQNVAFGLHGLSGDERRRRTRDALELVRLSELAGRYPHELSGGQQQRVALARTLAPSPIAVLMDEPFSNLDAGMRRIVRQEIETILRDRQIAVIFVTHDREEAFAIADRVGVMTQGRLRQINTPDILYRFPHGMDVARIVGECDFIGGVARGNIVETEIGSLPYISEKGRVPEGAALTVMVRPQDIEANADAGGNCLVESHEYRGGETALTVRTPSGATLQCRAPGYSVLAKGAPVQLTPKQDRAFWAFPNPCPAD